ncbi:MAG: hypothetical protein WA919_01405 [Coleofasciculaceae cyanobacterium]
MSQNAQGIPGLPDITHPQELMGFGQQLLSSLLTIALLAAALGIVIALISATLRRTEPEQAIFMGEWVVRYSALPFTPISLELTLLAVLHPLKPRLRAEGLSLPGYLKTMFQYATPLAYLPRLILSAIRESYPVCFC